jgi:hypothetical protein
MFYHYTEAIRKLRPNTEFTTVGQSVEGITWIKPKNVETPTQDEIDAAIEEIKKEEAQAEIAKANTKKSAIAKLAALGLTQEEAAILLG